MIPSTDKHGLTALHIGTANDEPEIVRMLLAHPDIDPGLENKTGLTPLKMATLRGKTEALKVTYIF